MQKPVITVVVLTGLGAAVWFFSPAARTVVQNEAESLFGWTEAARQADPVGFVEHVEQSLTEDLEELRNTRRALADELTELGRKHREQQALLKDAEEFANQFRVAFQAGEFPVTVRSLAYTEGNLKAQTSSLLAEIAGYRANVAKLEKVRTEGEQRLEELTVRVEKTETELAALGTQRELLRSQVLSDDAESLLAAVDDLFHENRQTISDNPVRSVRELLAAGENEKPQEPADESRVVEFLTTSLTEVQAAVLSADQKSIPVSTTQVPATQTQTSLNEVEVIQKTPAGSGSSAQSDRPDEKPDVKPQERLDPGQSQTRLRPTQQPVARVARTSVSQFEVIRKVKPGT